MSGDSVTTRSFALLLGLFLLSLVTSFVLFERKSGQITFLIGSAELVLFVFLLSNSDDDHEVTQQLASIQYQPSGPSALPNGIDEARATLDTQIENLNDIDTKAIRILRINVLLIGLILSALTFSAKTPTVPFDEFLNVYLGTGIVLLISSTATAGLTYTASDARAGMSKSNLVTMLDEDLTDEELDLILSKSYAKWIHGNQSTEVLNSFYSTSTILLLIYAVTYLSLGVYDALVGPVPLLLEGVSNVSLLAITLASGYPSQVRQVLREVELQL